MQVKLSNLQWDAIEQAVANGDRKTFEELVRVAVWLRERDRKRELSEARKYAEPAWLPERF